MHFRRIIVNIIPTLSTAVWTPLSIDQSRSCDLHTHIRACVRAPASVYFALLFVCRRVVGVGIISCVAFLIRSRVSRESTINRYCLSCHVPRGPSAVENVRRDRFRARVPTVSLPVDDRRRVQIAMNIPTCCYARRRWKYPLGHRASVTETRGKVLDSEYTDSSGYPLVDVTMRSIFKRKYILNSMYEIELRSSQSFFSIFF